MTEDTLNWASAHFGIPKEDIKFYHSGICYSRIVVKTKESADKVTAKVKNGTVNGGYFHGMPLGGQSVHTDDDGNTTYDVTC